MDKHKQTQQTNKRINSCYIANNVGKLGAPMEENIVVGTHACMHAYVNTYIHTYLSSDLESNDPFIAKIFENDSGHQRRRVSLITSSQLLSSTFASDRVMNMK